LYRWLPIGFISSITAVYGFLWKKLIPQRINEVAGVHHIKSYIVDDDLIMTGANLSDQYFINRQDRYVAIKSKDLSNYYSNMISTISNFSYKYCNTTSKLILPPDIPNPVYYPIQFEDKARKMIINFESQEEKNYQLNYSKNNALIFPTLQIGPIGISQKFCHFKNRMLENKLMLILPLRILILQTNTKI